MLVIVRVVDEDDDERTLEGKTVTLYGTAANSFGGTGSAVESTDGDGEAVFDMDENDLLTYQLPSPWRVATRSGDLTT